MWCQGRFFTDLYFPNTIIFRSGFRRDNLSDISEVRDEVPKDEVPNLVPKGWPWLHREKESP